jgi:hypothetical protein
MAGQLGCGQVAYWQKISVFGTVKYLSKQDSHDNTLNFLGFRRPNLSTLFVTELERGDTNESI